MAQLDLFRVDKNKTITHKEIEEEHVTAGKKELLICLEYLRTAHYLWDMRAWNNYKDIKEVTEYVDNPDFKNDGRSKYCVKQLNKAGVPKDIIIKTIMKNENISHKGER